MLASIARNVRYLWRRCVYRRKIQEQFAQIPSFRSSQAQIPVSRVRRRTGATILGIVHDPTCGVPKSMAQPNDQPSPQLQTDKLTRQFAHCRHYRPIQIHPSTGHNTQGRGHGTSDSIASCMTCSVRGARQGAMPASVFPVMLSSPIVPFLSSRALIDLISSP